MSFLPSARSASSDPLSSRLKRIQEELRKAVQDNFQLEEVEKQDANATDYSVLRWNDTASFVSAKPVTDAHLMPIEPKPDLCMWWFRHDHRGNFLYDQSGNDNHGKIIGQPRLNPNGVDWGAFGGDICSEYSYWLGGSMRDVVLGVKQPTLNLGAKSDVGGVMFDGVDDYINHGADTTKWNNAALAKFSVSLWINPTKMYDGFTRNITYMGWAGNWSWIVYHYPTLARVYLEMIGPATPTRIAVTYNTGVTTPGRLYHIAVVYDSTLPSARAKIYVNGVVGIQVTDLAGGAVYNNPSSSLIQGGTTDDFLGRQLDYRWWTNVALSQANVTQLYNDGVLAEVNPSIPFPDYWVRENEPGTPQVNYNSYVQVPDTAKLRIAGLNNFSVSALVYQNSFQLTNGLGDVWISKVDDLTLTNAYQLQTSSDGRAYFLCNVAGVARNYMTTSPVMHGGAWYWVVGTYDGALADPKSKIYVNGAVQPISIGGTPQFLAGGTRDLLLGIGQQLDRGQNYGRIQDTRLYNKTLSATEVLNLWTNKISITDTVFGQTATIGGSPFNE